MTVDPLVRWEQIRELADKLDWARLGTNTMRLWLGNHPRERQMLFALSDDDIAHGVQEWRVKLPNGWKPEWAVPALIDWADKRKIALDKPVKGPVGCEFCDDGEIAYTAHLPERAYPIRPAYAYLAGADPAERVAATGTADGYDLVGPCPECNGGTWPDGRPPQPNGGEYREGFRPHEIEELPAWLCRPDNPYWLLLQAVKARRAEENAT